MFSFVVVLLQKISTGIVINIFTHIANTHSDRFTHITNTHSACFTHITNTHCDWLFYTHCQHQP